MNQVKNIASSQHASYFSGGPLLLGPHFVKLDTAIACRHNQAAFLFCSTPPYTSFASGLSISGCSSVRRPSSTTAARVVVIMWFSHSVGSTWIWNCEQRSMLVKPWYLDNNLTAGPLEHSHSIWVLWLSESKSCRDLTTGCAPYKTRHLRVTVECCQCRAGKSVQKVNPSVVRTTSDRQQTSLLGTEGNRFDRR